MTSTAQINANRENAKHSTGPTSEAGAARSSQNALRHGLTGQTLVLSPGERDAYELHVAAHMEQHKPVDYMHRQLVQQKADGYWSLHQVFVQQTATLSIMMAITTQMSAAGAEPAATAAALIPVNRTLATLSTYESRRRRALKSIEADLEALEQELADTKRESLKTMKTNEDPSIGFVHPQPQSTADILAAAEKQEAEVARMLANIDALDAINQARATAQR